MNNPNTTAETRRESYEAITTETSKRGALILDVLGDKQMTVDEIVNELIARRDSCTSIETLSPHGSPSSRKRASLKRSGNARANAQAKMSPSGRE